MNAFLVNFVLAAAIGAAAESPNLEPGFRSPPDAARPWAYWWWVAGNVTEQSIQRDLTEAKKKGIGGLLMFDARGYHDDITPPPPAPMEFMSPQWRALLHRALVEADRLGLKMSINLSICAGSLRGPWNVGDDAPKELVWATQEVRGPQRLAVQVPRGDWGRTWEIALLAGRHAADANGKPALDEVVDLSDKVDQGRLAWEVPAGQWTVYRFACQCMKDREKDVDILAPAAVEGHFNRMGKVLLDDAGPLAGKTLTHFYSVSWEGAAPTWSIDLEKQFQQYRGYGLRPYLPILAGAAVRGPEIRDRFLRDYYKTLGDMFRDNFYGRLRELCHAHGLKWHSESGGPWERKLAFLKVADQLAFLARNDMPQGEFWHMGGARHAMNRPAAMTAHTYGLPLAATESFTHMRPHWTGYPAALKPDGDAAFCDGSNFLVWHTFTASPPEFGRPGLEYFAGTHLNPNVTWWEQAGPFLAYLARCQYLLRQGRFVADVCCYTGDKPYQHWGRGEKWYPKATLSLPKGYTYDLLNNEVLLERLSVAKGGLVLPDGMRYRILVVDLEDETAEPEALRKVAELAEAGATVVLGTRRPERTPGLKDFPQCDAELRRLADRLWGSAGAAPGARALGKGRVIAGVDLDKVLQSPKSLPDFEGPWEYTHRRAGATDIYFVAGKGEGECAFRVRGKEPELWDATTARVRDAVHYRTLADGRTLVPLSLPEGGSVFVVFRKPAAESHLVAVEGPLEIQGRSAGGARVHLWQNAVCKLETGQHKHVTVDAPQLPDPLPLVGPWEVRFAPGMGAPASIIFDRLTPWNEHPQPAIKFFSGTATYRESFSLNKEQSAGLVRLQLGQVKYIAEVRLNGKRLGVVWTDPWSADLTGVVRTGENQLEIAVTNLWPNRLIGDAALPLSQRVTKTNAQRDPTYKGRIPYLRGYLPTDPLLPSGLLGPVTIQFGVPRDVPFFPFSPGVTGPGVAHTRMP